MIKNARKNSLNKYTLSLFFIFSLLLIFPNQKGWSPKIYRSICLDTLKLMPPSLRGIFQIHKQALLRGVQQQPSKLSQKSQLIDSQVSQIVAMINSRQKFSSICFQFGQLCRLASDINNPLFIKSKDPQESLYYKNFITLTETNLDNFTLAFDGYDRCLLEENNLKLYLNNTISQSEELYPFFRKFMLLQGRPIKVTSFTPRSIPFALASLCYCRSVSTTANLWLHSWKKANGDISETPFYSSKKR